MPAETKTQEIERAYFSNAKTILQKPLFSPRTYRQVLFPDVAPQEVALPADVPL